MVEEKDTNHVIVWLPDGDGFQITGVQLFCEQILPKYFDHNKFTSFIRQLNMYDFCKQRGSSDVSVFRHPSFLKGKRHLIHRIKRKTNMKHEKNALKRQEKIQRKQERREKREQ